MRTELETARPRPANAVIMGLVAILMFSRQGTAGEAVAPTFRPVTIEGLSHNIVGAIAQDREGFLWFGTWDGLDRWDGYEVSSFRHDPDDEASLSHNRVSCLFVDSKGTLWVGTAAGLDRLLPSTRSFRHYRVEPAEATPADSSVLAIAEVAGDIWVGTARGLRRLDRVTDRLDSPVDGGLPADASAVVGVVEGPDGAPWILANGWPRVQSVASIFRVEKTTGRLTRFALPTEAGEPSSFTLLVDRKGRFWAHGVSPYQLDLGGSRLVAATTTTRASVDAVSYSAVEDSDGRVWVGTSDGLFLQQPGDASSAVRVPLGRRSSRLDSVVLRVFEDDAGTIWVATLGGLYRHDPAARPFTHLASDPRNPDFSLAGDEVAALAIDHDGALWVGLWGEGLDRVDLTTGRVVHFRHSATDPRSLPTNVVRALHVDQQGVLWLAAEERLCRYDRAEAGFSCWRVPARDLPRPVWAIAEGPRGMLWIGTNWQGLFSFDPRTESFRDLSVELPAGGPSSAAVEAIAFEGDDALWLGTSLGVLDRLDLSTGLFSHHRLAPAGAGPSVPRESYDLHIDDKGRLWVGTSDGLFAYDPTASKVERWGPADGIPGSYVVGLLADDQGVLWLATNRGIARFDPSAARGVQVRVFDLSDGLGSLELNRRARVRGPDGTLYFGGMQGVTWFHPEAIRDNPHPPRLAMSAAWVTDRDGSRRAVSAGGSLVFAPDDRELTVQLAALNFTSPARNRYRYRLAGLEEDWVDAGTRRSLSWSHLPPGRYVLEAQGSNNDGLWGPVAAPLAIEVLPVFWVTWWFRALMAAAIAGALLVFHRLRVTRLLAVERVRLRIASDLHDDLSSDLSGIALTMELLSHHEGLGDGDRRRVGQVRERALALLDGVRDIVWYVDPEHDNLGALAQRMRSVAGILLAGREISMQAELADPSMHLEMACRRNLFMMFKETLHNIARHSKATRVEILLRSLNDALTLRVRDDGVGFDPASPVRGMGLRSLERRALALGGELRIDSRRDGGTVVELSAPITGRRQRPVS